MRRRALHTLVWAVVGYLLGAMASFVILSLAFGNRVNSASTRGTRDRWAFILALVGLVIGAVVAWWRTSELGFDLVDEDD